MRVWEWVGEAGRRVWNAVCMCMYGSNGNIYMNGLCIARDRHNSSDLELDPALSLQTAQKHKATLLFPIPEYLVCVVSTCRPFLNCVNFSHICECSDP